MPKVEELITQHETMERINIELKKTVLQSLRGNTDQIFGYILGSALKTADHASDTYYDDSFEIANSATEGVLILLQIIADNPQAEDANVTAVCDVFKIEISAHEGCNPVNIVCTRIPKETV